MRRVVAATLWGRRSPAEVAATAFLHLHLLLGHLLEECPVVEQVLLSLVVVVAVLHHPHHELISIRIYLIIFIILFTYTL